MKRTTRRLALLFAAAFTIGLAVPATATGATTGWHLGGHPHATATATRLAAGCTGRIVSDGNHSYDWDTKWQTNNGCWQRATEQCRNPINGAKRWYDGRWTRSIGALSGDHCPAGAQQWQGGADYGHQAGPPYTYRRMWDTKQAHTTALAVPAGSHGTRSGVRHACPWKYSWKVSSIGGWGYVVWDINPCNYAIQSKGNFTDLYEHHYTRYSGYCHRVGLQCKVSARSATDSIDNFWRRIQFNNWYPWRFLWSG